MQHFSFIFLFISTIILGSCKQQSTASADAKDTYSGLFNIRCMQPNNRYHAEVRFSKDVINGEVNAASTLPTEVNFLEKKMDLLREMNIFALDGNFSQQKNATFTWEHPKGTPNSFVMDIRPIGKPAFLKKPASHSVANSLVWEGNPLGENETLVLFVENEKGETHTMPVRGAHTEARLDIPAAEMVKMPLGKCKFYLIRRHAVLNKSSNLKLNGIFEYYSDEAAIDIIK